MKTSHLCQEKPAPIPLPTREQLESLTEDDLLELFPLPRYFQVHFQHVHENADNVQRKINHLQRHMLRLEAKLDILLAALNVSQEPIS